MIRSADIALEAKGVVRRYPLGKGLWFGGGGRFVQAVAGVDLAVKRGETLAIVGESGCGKSTLARMLLRLEAPDEGEVWFDGADIGKLSERQMRPLRRKLQIVFQDPFASLNPRMTLGEIVEEPLLVHGLGNAAERRQRVREMLELVGLGSARLDRYPHEFSGGQRQRIGIARALVAGPEIVVGDEPVSALDVSVQAQVINLLQELKAKLGLTLVVITHDLGVVRHMADRVGVMYLGRLVELGPTDTIFAEPRHPYTQALLAAVPKPDPRQRGQGRLLEGDLPSPASPPPGCRFHTRCPHVAERCRSVEPVLEDDRAAHATACHRWREVGVRTPVVEAAPSAARRRRDALWLAARRRQEAAVAASSQAEGRHQP